MNLKYRYLLALALVLPGRCYSQTASTEAPESSLNADSGGALSSGDAADGTPSTRFFSHTLSTSTSAGVASPLRPEDYNSQIYYKNKLEFALQTGGLFINTPFIFDVFVGGDYSHNPLHYTLVPIFPSIRWQLDNPEGPWFLRGNFDVTATLSLTPIPRGPEKIYGAFDLGIRRNFVPRHWKVAPYFEGRLGAGFIDAQERHGYPNAQGEDYTFTIWVGTGVRYNFNQKWSAELGGTYMHVSNAYLSEPKYDDNGINVVGPVIGFNMRLGKPKTN